MLRPRPAMAQSVCVCVCGGGGVSLIQQWACFAVEAKNGPLDSWTVLRYTSTAPPSSPNHTLCVTLPPPPGTLHGHGSAHDAQPSQCSHLSQVER